MFIQNDTLWVYKDMIQIVVYDTSLQAFGELFICNEYKSLKKSSNICNRLPSIP